MTKLIRLNDDELFTLKEMTKYAIKDAGTNTLNVLFLQGMLNALQKDCKPELIDRIKQIKTSDGRYLQDSTGIINDAINLIKEY